MLKKVIIASAVLAISSTSALAFSGPYVGADVGGNYGMFKDQSNGATVRLGGLGSMGDLFIGYGTMVNQRVYLGGEVFGADFSNKVTQSASAAGISAAYDLKTRYSYGASILPGLMLNDATMAYARLGLVRTQFGVKVNVSPIGIHDSVKQTTTGEQAGLGLQTVLNPKLSVRGEYDFVSYDSFHALGQKISPTAGQVKLGLIYKLD